MSISVIIPCFNEEKNLKKIINKSLRFIKLVKNSEIILVNNGSTDNSINILKIKKNKNLKIINIKKNIGYGHGIKTGLKFSKKTHVSWTHADLQCDIFDVQKGYNILIKKKNNEKYFIKGKRENRNKFDIIFSYSMALISSFFLKVKMTDINAQPKIFHRRFIKMISNGPNDFNLDLFVYSKLLKVGLNEVNISVYFKKRKYGIAKGGGSILGKISLSLKTLKYIFKKI